MEQPSLPNPNATPSSSSSSKDNNKPTKKKLPSPQELISHYQSQGLDSEAASIKVIEDLQGVLFKVISTNTRTKKDKFMAEASRKVDVLSTRVAVLDMKLDSKPGFLETFAIGVASGATLKGVEFVWPHVVGGIAQIWNAVWTATQPPSSPSPPLP